MATRVQGAGSTETGQSTTLTISSGWSTSTVGNLITVVVAVRGGTGTTVAVTDNNGNTYTGDVVYNAGGTQFVGIYHSVTAATASTITASASTIGTLVMFAEEWSNPSGWSTVAVDVTATNAQTTGTAAASGSITTTNANDLVIAGYCWTGSGTDGTFVGGFTNEAVQTSSVPGNIEQLRAAYLVLGTSGTHAASATLSATAGNAGAIVAYKIPSGAATYALTAAGHATLSGSASFPLTLGIGASGAATTGPTNAALVRLAAVLSVAGHVAASGGAFLGQSLAPPYGSTTAVTPYMVGVSVPTGASAGAASTSATRCSFRRVRPSDLADLGGLRGVLTEDPLFGGTINSGGKQLVLDLDHYPSELNFGDLIRCSYPDGSVAGYWKYEQRTSKLAATNSYQVTLQPLITEAADCDYNANWSADTSQPTPALGPVGFDTPVRQGLALTQHLTALSLPWNGITYSYSYNNATVRQTLDQGILFGGAGWWWYADNMGRVSMTNVSSFLHVWTAGREVLLGEWSDDIMTLTNIQTVIGAMPANATTSLTAYAADTNPLNPYSVPNLGRRAAPVYQDVSLLDQATVNALAVSLLGYGEQVTRTMTLTVSNYYIGRRPQPGDSCMVRMPLGDPTGRGPFTAQGPYLITDVTEHGGTFVYDIIISATMVVPVSAMSPDLAATVALQRLMQTPANVAVSQNGAVGGIGSGVVGGNHGGTVYNAVPGMPTGVFATSGVDNVAQVNNVFAVVSWSSAAPLDVVTRYLVRYRRATDPDVAASYFVLNTGVVNTIKIANLYQGVQYVFSVLAVNDINASSPWSAPFTLTAAVDVVAPPTPTGLTATRTPRGANIFWNGSPAGDLQGYLVWVNVANDGKGFRQVNQAPSLATSMVYTAPKLDGAGKPVLQNTVLVFQVAAVDWTGNQSAFTTATANVLTDGIVFDDLQAGNITAAGTIQGGIIRTAASGARVELDNAGERMYDGTAVDHGFGPGVTFNANTQTGNLSLSGAISASSISSPPGVSPSGELDLTGVPALHFVDTGGIERITVGSFTSQHDGSAQYGMQALNASGQAIFDTNGLISVMNIIANGYGNNGTVYGNATAWTPIGETNLSVSVARSTGILVLATCGWADQLTGSNYINIRLAIYGAGGGMTAFTQKQYHTVGSGVSNGTFYSLTSMDAGNSPYLARLEYLMNVGGSTQMIFENFQITAFQLGG